MAKKPVVNTADPLAAVRGHLANLDQTDIQANRAVSTGSPFIDLQINPRLPGWKTGKVHVVAGRPKTGKSSMLLSAARALLAKNKPGDPKPRLVIYFDVENGLDDATLALYGLTMYHTPNFEYKRINYGPDVLGTIEKLIVALKDYESEVLIIVDSVPHLKYTKDDEYNDYAGTAAVAQGPNKLKVFFRENKNRLSKTNICLVFLTFMTSNIGRTNPHDPQYILSGGSFLEYAADTAIFLEQKGRPRETEIPPPSDPNKPQKPKGLGKFQDVKLSFHKNKYSPYKEFYYTLCLVEEPGYTPGIQNISLLVNYALDKHVAQQAGAWIRYRGGNWNGKKAFKEALKESVEFMKRKLEKPDLEPEDPILDGLAEGLYNDVRLKILEEHRMKE